MAVRGIRYEEGTNAGYEGVYVHYGDNEEKLFNTGNFVKDWFDALKWFILGELSEYLSNSSTVDHFIMDGAPYDSAYLVTDEQGVSELCYGENWHSLGYEIFVPEGTQPTWAELKEMCK